MTVHTHGFEIMLASPPTLFAAAIALCQSVDGGATKFAEASAGCGNPP
jgi:hypothetical protein